MPAIFQPRIEKNKLQAPSVRTIVTFSDHQLLSRDSYEGVDRALTPDESILSKIIIIIKSINRFALLGHKVFANKCFAQYSNNANFACLQH